MFIKHILQACKGSKYLIFKLLRVYFIFYFIHKKNYGLW